MGDPNHILSYCHNTSLREKETFDHILKESAALLVRNLARESDKEID